MKIKQLDKAFDKMIKKEIGADGYVRIDSVKIMLEGESEHFIEVEGAYGKFDADGEFEYQYYYRLFYLDGMSAENVAGMLYQKIVDGEK